MGAHHSTFDEFLGALAARTPTPGGGAAVAATAQIACALAAMVVNYSIGKKGLEAHQADLQSALAELERARAAFGELGKADEAAYAELNQAMKLPKESAERDVAVARAARQASDVPLRLIALATETLRQFKSIAPKTNTLLRSDLGIAAGLLDSAAQSSLWNIRANESLMDPKESAEIGRAARKLVLQSAQHTGETREHCYPSSS